MQPCILVFGWEFTNEPRGRMDDFLGRADTREEALLIIAKSQLVHFQIVSLDWADTMKIERIDRY